MLHRMLLAAALVAAPAAHAAHPLDPLSAGEIARFVEVLRKDGKVDASSRFPHIRLEEPAKEEVVAGDSERSRRAFGIVRNAGAVYEAVVDLDAGTISRYTMKEGVQSSILLEEWGAAQTAALADRRFTDGLAKRGITDTTKVFCAPFTMGYFAIPEDEGKRLLKVGCFDTRNSRNNIFGWPIENLYAVVDLGTGAVTSVHDDGVVPISPAELNFAEGSLPALRAPMKPVTVATPSGANVAIDGHEVQWQKWQLHAALDRRVGLVVSTVRYADRPVMYRAYSSEMFVPYHDPAFGWYSRSYFDIGEYGAGLLTTPLQPGIDCPAGAYFMPATINDDLGAPLEIANAICVFERNTGDPVWRHSEAGNQTYEGRPAIELVVRHVPTIGNYDYVIDYVFNLAGEITVRVGATGIDALKGVRSASMGDPTAAADTATGTLVAPHLVAVNHDHYINFMLDLDVDGTANTVVRDVYRKARLEGARASMYRIEPQPITAEGGFSPGHDITKWRVINPSKANSVGNPTGYELINHSHAASMLDRDEWVGKRGAFADSDLWVTAYDPQRRYAAGDYVFASDGSDGLAAWTAEPKPVAERDVVLWANIGFNHMTRAEDLPVMPTTWHELKLRPFNFHDLNPALDVRSQFAGP